MQDEPNALLPTEEQIEAGWNALKDQCCSDPKNAKRIVMVNRDQFATACSAMRALAKPDILEQISNLLSDAIQDDCENGVRWLNEIAAKNYLKEYPYTLQAIRKIQELIDNESP